MDTPVPTALIVDVFKIGMRSERLREIFVPFGPVMWSHIPTDRSRHALGFGYVVMHAEDAVKAIEALNGKKIDGRELTIAHTTIPDAAPSALRSA